MQKTPINNIILLKNLDLFLQKREFKESKRKKLKFDILEFVIAAKIKYVELLNMDVLSNYKSEAIKKYKVVTLNSKINSINLFLDFLDIGINLSPIRVQTKSFKENCIYDSDILQLLNHTRCNDYLMYCVIQTFIRTGIRVSELQFFDSSSVKNKRVEILLKNTYRVIIISDKLYEILEPLIETKKGKLFEIKSLNYKLKKLAKRVRIDASKIHAHNFRHYYARKCIKKNIDITLLKDLLGHASLNTTARYLQITLDTRKRIVNEHF